MDNNNLQSNSNLNQVNKSGEQLNVTDNKINQSNVEQNPKKVDPQINQANTESVSTPVAASSNNNQNKKGSKGKAFGIIFLFVLLLAFVFFLPDIRNYVQLLGKDKKIEDNLDAPKQLQQRMCILTDVTDSIKTSVKLNMQYENNALKKQTIINTIEYMADNNEEYLQNLQLGCQTFAKELEQYDGIKQECSLNDNKYTIKQTLDYKTLDEIIFEKNMGELEGFYPEFVYNQDKETIENALQEVGYKCSDVTN